MRLLWAHHYQEEDWGFLLIDDRNEFIEENRTAMIWAVQHKWTIGTHFTFNCYRHWATLVVRNTEDGSGQFFHRKEGMTKGYPLAMIAYGIGVIPLIRKIQDTHTHVTQPWYADDVGEGGKFGRILQQFQDLQERGTPRG